ncbi:MAG: hypothetical protein QXD70_01195 [Candidatus Bathyarchaeia archaeon]
MQGVWVEFNHPRYGLERYKIKVVRKFNVPTDTIAPIPNRRRDQEYINSIVVGRGVSEEEIMNYMVEYFKRTGMLDKVLWMKLM